MRIEKGATINPAIQFSGLSPPVPVVMGLDSRSPTPEYRTHRCEMKRVKSLLSVLGLLVPAHALAGGIALSVSVHPDSFPVMRTPLISQISVMPRETTSLYICAYSLGDTLRLRSWEGRLEGPAIHDPELHWRGIEFYPSSARNTGKGFDFQIDLGTCIAAPPESVVILAKATLRPDDDFVAAAFTLRGYGGECATLATTCSGESRSPTSSFSAIYKNFRIYGNQPYPRPDPIHPDSGESKQPVVAAIGKVTELRTNFHVDCWWYSLITVAIEHVIVGDPGGTITFLTSGSVSEGSDGRAYANLGFPEYMFQLFRPGDLIVFAAGTMSETRRRIAYDPFPVPYRIRYGEILLQPAGQMIQPTYTQTYAHPEVSCYPDTTGSVEPWTSFLGRTLTGSGHTLQERVDWLKSRYDEHR